MHPAANGEEWFSIVRCGHTHLYASEIPVLRYSTIRHVPGSLVPAMVLAKSENQLQFGRRYDRTNSSNKYLVTNNRKELIQRTKHNHFSCTLYTAGTFCLDVLAPVHEL